MAYDAWRGVCDWFWNETFWLPENRSWSEMKRNETVFYPDANDLWIPFPMAAGIFLLRIFWERCVALSIGRCFKLKESPPGRAIPNPILEEAFRKHNKLLPDHKVVVELSKKVDLSTRQVERWWRRRRVQGKASEMTRFTETSWRFMFYIVAFWSGLYILWDKPWTWDTKNCWYGHPLHHVPADVWWYYMIELGFYWSLVFSLFMDIKRKDLIVMIVHHAATIGLMVFSWSGNMVRIGTLVLCIHDAVDYLLEGAKLAHYCRFQNLCSFLFAAFAIVWLLSRILAFPLIVLRSTMFEGHVILGFKSIYYWYNGLLITLQILHVIWFYMILRMVYCLVIKGHLDKDERSETELETGSEDENISVKPPDKHSPISNNNLKERRTANQGSRK